MSHGFPPTPGIITFSPESIYWVIFFHYVPKKRQRKKVGHRQYYTRLRIEAIQA